MNRYPCRIDRSSWVAPILADECPLLPHLQALGEKPRPCMVVAEARLNTEILRQCPHYQDLAKDDDGPVVVCGYEEEAKTP